MQEYRITASCYTGCMTVEDMNREYLDGWSHCPYCGLELEKEVV